MIVRFLGTGTSTGVPQIGCGCETCASTDERDKRLRASVIVETAGKRLLIDCGPDFRQQILREGSIGLDAALLTHSHYDHVGGLDDLRPYCYAAKGGFPLYCQGDVACDLRARMPYSFAEHLYPGVPTFRIEEVRAYEEFEVEGVKVMPLGIMHGKLGILGYRIGRFGYVTDASGIPCGSMEMLGGLDVLVVNALRHEPHMSHMNLAEALDVINQVKPRRAYLTHLSHQMGRHADVSGLLPGNVSVAYDGLRVEI